MFNVDLNSSTPQVICHQNYQKYADLILEKLSPFNLSHHYILFSSGTSGGDLKGYALSRKALIANAQGVNDFFHLSSSDVWSLSLPVYHVGGLSVLFRAHLLQNQVIDGRSWDPIRWVDLIKGATITSIVPTQLYDLVKLRLSPPSSLKTLLVGGDFLSSKLKEKALSLGWPVMRTFGMSEVSSQLASASSSFTDDLTLLPLHSVKILNHRLMVKSPSLFTLEFTLGENFSVKRSLDLCDEEGFYPTQDLATLSGNILTPLGRLGEEIKISGHLVSINKLKDLLSNFLLERGLHQQMELRVEKDERKGHRLILFTLAKTCEENLVEEIRKIMNPVIIDEVRIVPEFLRTDLGKFKRSL